MAKSNKTKQRYHSGAAETVSETTNNNFGIALQGVGTKAFHGVGIEIRLASILYTSTRQHYLSMPSSCFDLIRGPKSDRWKGQRVSHTAKVAWSDGIAAKTQVTVLESGKPLTTSIRTMPPLY